MPPETEGVMNVKRFVAASLAVFAVGQGLGYLIHGVLLRAAYDSTKSLWRPDMESKMWIIHLVGFLTAFLFTFIFTKGYEGKGIGEGVRFGLLIGLYVSIPMAYSTYATMPIPYSLALQWFLYGTIHTIILGVVAAAVYRPAKTG